jgi:hypothetical protein
MVELRWAIPSSTTAERPRLQYRQLPGVVQFGAGSGWSEWQDVPYVVVPQEPKPAPSLASAFRSPACGPADLPPVPGEVCGNCDTALPAGCGGLFRDDGQACALVRNAGVGGAIPHTFAPPDADTDDSMEGGKK